MRPMADSRKRADVSSRTTAPDTWDAGLHAESEAGPIDVGLSVEPSALGLIIDAPGIGLLKLAFDVKPDGTTRLSRASRRLTDGRDASLVAIDESKVLQLEGALARLQKAHEEMTGTLMTERDEARDRAAVISEDRNDLKVDREGLRAQLSSITADLQTEKEGRLVILAEREKARAELERVRQEQDAGSTTLLGELTQVRTRLEQRDAQLTVALEESRQKVEAALETAREKASELESVMEKVTELSAALDASREKRSEFEAAQPELEAARARVAELESRLAAAESAYLGSSSQISAERDDARARVAALDDAVKQETEARELALVTARRERKELAAELEEVRAELAVLRSKPSETRATDQLTSDLEASYAARTQLEAEVQALRTAMEEGGSAQLMSDLEASYAARTQLEAEVQALRAAMEEGGSAQLMSDLEASYAARTQLEAEVQALRAAMEEGGSAQLMSDLEASYAARTQLEAEVQALRAAMEEGGSAQLMSDLEVSYAARTQLEAEVQALRAAMEEGGSAQLMSDLEASYAARTQLEAQLQAATSENGNAQLLSDLEAAQSARAQLEAQLQASGGDLEAARVQLEAAGETTAQLTTDLEAASAARIQLETENATLRATAGEAADADALRTGLEASRAELETLRAASAELEKELASTRAELDSLRASSGESTVTQTQLMADLEAAYSARATLEGELETLRSGAEGQSQLMADLEIAQAARAAAEAELEAARTNSTQLTADLEASNAARAQLDSEIETLRTSSAQNAQRAVDLETDLAAARSQPTSDPALEDTLNKAIARSEAFQSQLAAAEARMGAESAATREARDVALKLKAQAEKLQTERDEARTLARQLHVKLAGPRKDDADDLRTALDAERQVAANLVAERDQLNLRIEALGRMIDQERDGRARALSERDEWQLRFKSLARGSVDTSQPLDFSREETRSFMLERPTVPEMPAAKAEAVTDPAIPKKKGF